MYTAVQISIFVNYIYLTLKYDLEEVSYAIMKIFGVYMFFICIKPFGEA